MACKLCSGPGPIRQSHIIPESAYRPLYDAKHRAVAPDRKRLYVPWAQKGLREPLLCETCEQVFGRLEKYFFEFWKPQKLWPNRITKKFVSVAGFDYQKIKLFHLSVLWRAGVAKEYAFDQVSLGTHEQKIRNILLSLSFVPDQIYPVFAFLLRNPDTQKAFDHVVMPPAAVRIKGVRAYVMAFSSCALVLLCFKSTGSTSSSMRALRERIYYDAHNR